LIEDTSINQRLKKDIQINNKLSENKYNYKTCAGKGCNKIGEYFLKIIYVKKSGWFCSQCKKSLEEDGLIESRANEAVVIGEENNFANR
jgi:hypothetical protein